jgi:uncharacterized protein YjbJ (UPF0337 family)
MNKDILQGNWMQLKGKIKAEWGKLTDDQLDQVNGNADMLAGKIQEAYGVSRDEAERRISAWDSAARKAQSDQRH